MWSQSELISTPHKYDADRRHFHAVPHQRQHECSADDPAMQQGHTRCNTTPTLHLSFSAVAWQSARLLSWLSLPGSSSIDSLTSNSLHVSAFAAYGACKWEATIQARGWSAHHQMLSQGMCWSTSDVADVGYPLAEHRAG